jgi:hypothetical protein
MSEAYTPQALPQLLRILLRISSPWITCGTRLFACAVRSVNQDGRLLAVRNVLIGAH